MLTYVLFILVIIITFLITLKIMFINRYKKQIKKEHKRTEQYKNKALQLEKMIEGQTRRKSFRIDVHLDDCRFEIADVKRDLEKPLQEIAGRGIVRDLSFDGLRLQSEVDLPVKAAITLQISFTFENEPFTFKGVLLRKEERINERAYTYGLRFTEADLRSQNEFNKLLMAKELEIRNQLLKGMKG